MPIVSKCSHCNRDYTAAVKTCQICGGTCLPVSAEESSLRLHREAAASPSEAPRVTCPCCEAAPGPHTIDQQTRHLKDVSLIPMKRTYLVTTVKVPGVCDSCHRSLTRKRWLASVLLPLPLPLLFGILVVKDSPVALVPVVLYLVYVGSQIDYSWTDFLIYGKDLSWKLVGFVPDKDRESTPRYPAGILHILLRIGLLPGLLLLLFGIAQVFKKPAAAPGEAPVVAAPAKPGSVPGVVAVPTPVPSVTPAAPPTREQSILDFLNGATALAVPIDPDTRGNNASLNRPAAQSVVMDGRKTRVIRVYADETNVPSNTRYRMMNSVTLLIHCGGQAYDQLSVEDRQIVLLRREVDALFPKVAMATNHPSEIRIKPAH